MFAFALGLILGVGRADLHAQGITTATIAGVVTDDRGQGVGTAEIRVLNRATGVVTLSLSHANGRYVVQGLPVGGPYLVIARRIGFREETRDSLTLALGQTLRLDLVLTAVATELSPVTVEARQNPASSAAGGIAYTVPDEWLRRLPTVNRDLYGFVSLTPQVLSRGSAGGQNPYFNSVQLDGASDQAGFAPGLGAVWGGKPISMEAVQEYQVLLSPYDVRQGDFAGALISGVTKSGTNQLHGTAYYYWRNEQLAAGVPFLRSSPYDRSQFGFALGGPIVRDRLHFFLATEFQSLHAPAIGPYVGGPDSVPASASDIARFTQLLGARGLVAGSAGPVSNSNPLATVFARFDLALPRWNSRLVVRNILSWVDSNAFSRPIPRQTSAACPQLTCFPLSSMFRTQNWIKHSIVAQLSTNLLSGAYNSLTIGYISNPFSAKAQIPQPLIRVAVPPANGAPSAFLQAGSPDFAMQNDNRQQLAEIGDDFATLLGAHRIGVGAAARFLRVGTNALRNAFGTWEFSSLDALQAGTAAEYRVSLDRGGADATLSGTQLGLYGGDQWQVGRNLLLTFGLRLDVPFVSGTPPYAPSVDSAFGKRTDRMPSGHALWSPRVGFNWDVPGSRGQQLRGGVGLFAGRPPLFWWLRAFQNYGTGQLALRCSARSSDPGLPPAFPSTPDYRSPPGRCANGQTVSTGAVDVLDPGLRFPQALRASLGYEGELPGGVVALLEGLYTRGLSDFVFLNRNLAGPVGTDLHGRTMYGSLDTSGAASPAYVSRAFASAEVIELVNQSNNYSYSITGRLEKRFGALVEITAAYTYSVTRDVQTNVYNGFGENWAGRASPGRQDDLRPGISDLDQPHRVVLVGTITMPWSAWKTDLAIYYLGGSGAAYTYVAAGRTTASGAQTGDLNADGSSGNDPLYVPKSAFDTLEIQLAPTSSYPVAAQQQALEAFINGTPCLRRQRGRILQRNSCRSPWVHVLNASLRQSLPAVRGHTLTAAIEIFNLLNLVNRQWGLVERPPSPSTGLLTHVRQSAGQPVFQFDPTVSRYSSRTAESYYQIQLSARVSF